MTKNEEMLFHVFKKYKTVNFVNENNIFYEPSYSILFVDSFPPKFCPFCIYDF